MKRAHAIDLLNGDLASCQTDVADCRMGLQLDLTHRDWYDAHCMPECRRFRQIQVQLSQRALRDARQRRHSAFGQWQKERRAEHVVQALDRANEARGVATGIIGAYKRAMRTPEEQAEQVEQDTLDLFGPTRE